MNATKFGVARLPTFTDVEAGQMTESGRACITWALDPCADTGRDLVGLCDTDSSPTVPLVYTDEVTLSNPTSSGTTWSAVIFTMPTQYATNGGGLNGVVRQSGTWQNQSYDGTQQRSISTASQITDVGSSTTAYNAQQVFNTVNIFSWNADGFGGSNVAFPDGTASFVMPNSIRNLGLSVAPDGACSRLIGLAIEVIDVTALLNQQGLITISRTPCRINNTDCVPVYAGTNAFTAGFQGPIPQCMCTAIEPIPTSISAALRYPTTVQWPVKEGCYAVAGFDMQKNPLVVAQGAYLKLLTPGSAGPASGISGFATPTFAAGTNGQIALGLATVFASAPIDNTAIFMTGLAPTGSYTIRVRKIYEIAPQVYDQNLALVPAARPSPKHDAFALEVYQRVVRIMPPAVPFGLNPAGEWFSYIMNGIKTVASAIAPTAAYALGGAPAARAVSRLIAPASGSTDVVINRRSMSVPKPKSQKKKVVVRSTSRASSAGSKRSAVRVGASRRSRR